MPEDEFEPRSEILRQAREKAKGNRQAQAKGVDSAHDLLTRKEAWEYLRISRTKLHDLVKLEKKLVPLKQGRRTYFMRQDLTDYLADLKAKAQEEG